MYKFPMTNYTEKISLNRLEFFQSNEVYFFVDSNRQALFPLNSYRIFQKHIS